MHIATKGRQATTLKCLSFYIKPSRWGHVLAAALRRPGRRVLQANYAAVTNLVGLQHVSRHLRDRTGAKASEVRQNAVHPGLSWDAVTMPNDLPQVEGESEHEELEGNHGVAHSEEQRAHNGNEEVQRHNRCEG